MAATAPWDDVMPMVEAWRRDGQSWTAITDTINYTYGTALTAASVKARFAQHSAQGGYRVPAGKGSRSTMTASSVKAALAYVNTVLGRAKSEPVSITEYDQVREKWREGKGRGKAPVELPSSISIRRRFGTWAAACHAAGVKVNEPRRHYDGLTRDDVVVWLARWLRELRQVPGVPLATSARYRMWLSDNPAAPGLDAIRNVGVWSELVADAETMERKGKRLPDPKGVSSGPGKSKMELLPLPPR